MTKKNTLVKISKIISEMEGAGVFVENDGTISFNGLNQTTYDSYRKSQNKMVQDVRNAKYGEFIDILDKEFIGRHGIKNVPEEYLPIVADMSWNSGPRNAAVTFQKTVGAEPDGIIGPKTIKKFEEYISENDFIDGFSNNRINFLTTSQDESVQKNLDGLLNRVENIRVMFKSSGDVITGGKNGKK